MRSAEEVFGVRENADLKCALQNNVPSTVEQGMMWVTEYAKRDFER